MTTLDLTTPEAAVGTALDEHRVYTRVNWSDPWFEVTDSGIYCDFATWSVAGLEINRAQLVYRYGRGMRPGQTSFSTIARGTPESLLKLYVKVEFGPANPDPDGHPENEPWRWVGTIESIGDNISGGSNPPHGELRMNCFGMEFQLEQFRVIESVMQETSSLAIKTTSRGITFNHRGRGNRSKDWALGADYVFGYDHALYTPSEYFWSTQDIVGYLIKTQTDRSAGGAERIPWLLHPEDEHYLPSYDAPQLYSHGRRVLELLNNLVTRERGIIWWPEYDDKYNLMLVRVTSFSDVDVSLGSGYKIPKNDNVDSLLLSADASTGRLIRTVNTLDAVDQILVQGARRTSTFSINHDRDNTAAAAWTPAQESDYNQGAQGWSDYAALNAQDLHRKRLLNAEARARDELAAVYREITLPIDWDKLAGDGLGGEKNPVIPIDGDPTKSAPLYPKEAYFSRNLALLKGRDYSGSAISQGTFRPHSLKPHEPLAPFALALTPEQRQRADGDRRWIYSDEIGQTADLPYTTNWVDREWSCRVRVLPEATSIQLDVQGTNQHVLAGQYGFRQFTGLPEDNWDGLPEFDWREWIYTVSLIEDRFCEYRWPADDDLPALNTVRQLIIDAGESYRRDYVVPQTIVGINRTSGKLLRSTSGGYVRDDTSLMESVAKAAWTWYGTHRTAIQFDTVFRAPANQIRLGNYIKYLDPSDEVNSIVTELRITHSEVANTQTPENALLSVSTGFAELDPQAFLPALP